MTKYYLNVNQAVIRHNKKHNTNLPPCRVQRGRSGKARYCQEVQFEGKGSLVNGQDRPLACGARVWIELEGAIKLIEEVAYSKIQERMKKRG